MVAAITDCRLTNPNEVPQDAVACFVSAIKSLIIEPGNVQKAYEEALAVSQTETIRQILEAAKEKPAPVYVPSCEAEVQPDHKSMGYCGIALQVNFHFPVFSPSEISYVSESV